MSDPEIDALIQRLASEDPADREAAANSLGDHGEAAAAAVPALMERMLEDVDQSVRVMAINALMIVGSPSRPALVHLEKLKSDPDEEIAEMADIAIHAIQGA